VELRSSPPPAEGKLDISAPLRKVVAVEIPIMNPSSEPLEFDVSFQGDALYGDDTISVPAGPNSTALYELLYSPLVAGVTRGSIAFVNSLAGEFWYELSMTAEAPTPIELPTLQCGVGDSVTHTFSVSNPIGEELVLKVGISNSTNFSLASATAQTQLVLAPYAELECVLTFTPSNLDAEQTTDISLSHPKLGEWLYIARGIGLEPNEMPPTEVTAALGQPTSGTITFRNPFETSLMLTVALEQMGAHDGEGAFKLLRRSNAQVVNAGASLQLPFAFSTNDMSERGATLVVKGELSGRPLAWRFPISGVAVSRPLQRPIHLQTAARQPLQRELTLPVPGLDESAAEEAYTYELDVPAEHSDILGRTLRLTPLQRSLAGPNLLMQLEWQPLRPLRTSAALVVQKASGGRWRYDFMLEAREPEPDDIISIEASLNKASAVSFRLSNLFDVEAPFTAYFTPESPSVFSVKPVTGILGAAGAMGTTFTVSYSPTEYGKLVRGSLVILTDEMQWSYEVRGSHPVYEVPNISASRIDHKLQPEISQRLGTVPGKNFLRQRASGGS